MGEKNRVLEFGPQARVNHHPPQPQQIQVDLKNATPKTCRNEISFTSPEFGLCSKVCGCDIFIPAVKLYTVSALVSPTGQELLAQQPVLVCKSCGQAVSV